MIRRPSPRRSCTTMSHRSNQNAPAALIEVVFPTTWSKGIGTAVRLVEYNHPSTATKSSCNASPLLMPT
ncbi:hypothetical protein ATANTOWER_031917 [Ataeniobius toweri]|uniref:Uncharacterized protein n=1 Tax=Ataeniobius toweri TaxID=208326 RepID=A0ABU7B979_9TELE|nr:hypothetical protein [Ataeniobius toweri]